MATTSESQVLVDVLQDVRGLTKYYLAQTEGIDPHKSFKADGVEFNSLYWMIAHLTWAQHFLLVEALTGDKAPYAWMDDFQRAAPGTVAAGAPDWDEVLRAFDEVHEKSVVTVSSLSDEELDQPNHLGLAFRGGDSKRVIIRHAIRHEPMHTGHISWICKMAGKDLG